MSTVLDRCSGFALNATMKSLLKSIAYIIAVLTFLGFGYWAGTETGLFKYMWVASAVTQSMTKASILSMRVGQINEGKIDVLKSQLNMELDAEILGLASLIDWQSPSENDTTGIKTIRRIANQRQLSNYTNSEPEIQEQLLEIYDKASAYQIQGEINPVQLGPKPSVPPEAAAH